MTKQRLNRAKYAVKGTVKNTSSDNAVNPADKAAA
jgi:hypothetical protein